MRPSFGDCCEVASLSVLREIEASLLLARSVSFCRREETVSLHLSVSKTDPRALSGHRTWRCTCGGGAGVARAFQAAYKQHQLLHLSLGTAHSLLCDLPLSLCVEDLRRKAHMEQYRRSLEPKNINIANERSRQVIPSQRCETKMKSHLQKN